MAQNFKPSYTNDGKLREYYFEGDNGQDYFIYKDRTGYTLRDMSKEDIIPWCEALKIRNNIPPKFMPVKLAQVDKQIEKQQNEEELGRTLLIFNPKEEMIGEMQFTVNEEKTGSSKVAITLLNTTIVKTKGSKILLVIQRMLEQTRLYDEVFVQSSKNPNEWIKIE